MRYSKLIITHFDNHRITYQGILSDKLAFLIQNRQPIPRPLHPLEVVMLIQVENPSCITQSELTPHKS